MSVHTETHECAYKCVCISVIMSVDMGKNLYVCTSHMRDP